MRRRRRSNETEGPQWLDPWEDDGLFGGNDVVAAGECTGAVPTPPVGNAQADAYADLIPPPSVQPERSIQPEQPSPQEEFDLDRLRRGSGL